MEEILLVNPRRRKRRAKRSKWYSVKAHQRNPRHRRGGHKTRRRRLRNPRFGMPSVKSITGEIGPALIGAVGAMGLDIGMAYLPLPTMLQSGWGKVAAQLGGALALGFIAAKIPGVGRSRAQAATLGALTIVAYNAIRPLAASTIGDKVKGLSGLADFGDFQGMGAYMNPAPALLTRSSPIANAQSGMGAYMQRSLGATAGDFF